MSKINSSRKGCRDVFNAFLVSLATYAGFFEFPRIRPTYDVPKRIIAFSQALSSRDYFMKMIICLSVYGEIRGNTSRF